MSHRITKAALVLVGLTVASQAPAGQPQRGAVQSYWQNLKQQLTAPAASAPVQQNRPAAVTSVRG